MNKRQRKKWFKKNYEIIMLEPRVTVIEWGPSPLEAYLRDFKADIARAFAVPPHMLFGHRLGGYGPKPLLIGWDGPRAPIQCEIARLTHLPDGGWDVVYSPREGA